MTSEELMQIEKCLLDRKNPNYELSKKIMDACEKQTPKKPKQTEHIGTSVYFNKPKSECTHLFRGYCPNCITQNTNRRISQVITYCEKCGQALDWSDTE